MAAGRIQIDDGELNYEARGEGRPVVLLHDGMLDGRIWDAQMTLLAARNTVVRYDARGHGRSSTPTKAFAHYRDLRQLLDSLGFERVSLVGVSMGARTSIDFALAHPDRVEKLILIGPGISGMTFRDPFVLDQIGKLNEAGRHNDLGGVVEALLRMWLDGPHRTPEDVDPQIRERCRELTTDTLIRHGAAAQTFMTELDGVNRASELHVPIQLVLGELDSTDIRDVADLIEREARHTHQLTVPGAAHLVNLERPAEFNDILLDSI